jgi:hypothetical protein
LVVHFDDWKAGRTVSDLIDIADGVEEADDEGELHHRIGDGGCDDAIWDSGSDVFDFIACTRLGLDCNYFGREIYSYEEGHRHLSIISTSYT